MRWMLTDVVGELLMDVSMIDEKCIGSAQN